MIGKWQDRPAHSAMINAARRLGYDLTAHRAQQISLDMLDRADTVLAMDASVLATLRAVCGPENENRLRLYLGDRDVPDPMGQDDAAFHECAVLIEVGAALHIGGRIT
ncbi:hypothetical protein ACFTZJ_20810 [Streptomyces globisporus]|uniref:arsenate reductase/protein-tyrosine-phosphatase family protein n=1 Tax=Streptomyces globisporus TaxID=1908 RepID=UPI003640FF00